MGTKLKTCFRVSGNLECFVSSYVTGKGCDGEVSRLGHIGKDREFAELGVSVIQGTPLYRKVNGTSKIG